jgi:diaminohydroxyphosphoribosylaminopyrimidine deaminase/5-amino-6-(5-phosphoribosylamino)uracil reductase
MVATPLAMDDVRAMRAAIAEGERARGTTGDNPWVGSVLVVRDAIIAVGYTRGPGEDHAEIGALREARRVGLDWGDATLYSTLEPCSFHGRTPACAKVIAESGIRRIVVGIRDPDPRVDGAGIAIVRAAGVEVKENVCADEVRRQLGPWIVRYHPHELLRRARSIAHFDREDLARAIADVYAISDKQADEMAALVRREPRTAAGESPTPDEQ